MEGFNRAMNLMLTEEELEEIMRNVDSDGSGYVEYDEFIRSTVKRSTMLSQRNLEIAFNFLVTKTIYASCQFKAGPSSAF